MTELLDDVSRQADALGQAFKENQSEIHRLQTIHKDLEKSKFDDVVLQGNSLVAQLCVLEEEKGRRQRNIGDLERDKEKTMQLLEEIRSTILEKSTEYEEMKRKLSEYVFKMKIYKEGVTAVESSTPILKKVAKVKENIDSLQEKKLELEKDQLGILTSETGIVRTKDQLQSEVTEIKQQIEERKDAYKDKQQQLECAREKRKGLEMTNFVLTKKNSALLIRMKKKVEEQKDKHLGFVKQRDYLLKMVDTTSQKLERFEDNP